MAVRARLPTKCASVCASASAASKPETCRRSISISWPYPRLLRRSDCASPVKHPYSAPLELLDQQIAIDEILAQRGEPRFVFFDFDIVSSGLARQNDLVLWLFRTDSAMSSFLRSCADFACSLRTFPDAAGFELPALALRRCVFEAGLIMSICSSRDVAARALR